MLKNKIIVIDYVHDLRILNFENLKICNFDNKIIKSNGIKRGHGFSVINALKQTCGKNDIIFIPLSIDSNLCDLVDSLNYISNTFMNSVVNISLGFKIRKKKTILYKVIDNNINNNNIIICSNNYIKNIYPACINKVYTINTNYLYNNYLNLKNNTIFINNSYFIKVKYIDGKDILTNDSSFITPLFSGIAINLKLKDRSIHNLYKKFLESKEVYTCI